MSHDSAATGENEEPIDSEMASLAMGQEVILDQRHAGWVRYKGEVEGKDGTWLGVELENTVGDSDGEYGGKRYFTCSDGCSIFIRESADRLMAKPSLGELVDDLNIPPQQLQHMEFLFNNFEEDGSGTINEDQMLRAMKTLQGGSVTRADVRQMFTKFDEDGGDGVIDFVEFCHAMRDEWAGVDLGKIVEVIKDHDANEGRLAAAEQKRQEEMKIEDTQLTVRVGNPEGQGPGCDVNLKYFGAGTNAFLLLMYGVLALLATWQLFLEIPEDLFNKLLVITMGGMSALFAVGGYAMHTHNWPTVKLYAVLMFFGCGAQVTIGLLHWAGFFGVTSGTVLSVMDRKCGTCLGEDKTACEGGSLYDGLTGGGSIDFATMPWYCCCAHNECYDFSADLASAASCTDGCNLADLSGDQAASEASCQDVSEWLISDQTWNSAIDGLPRAACTYRPAAPADCTPLSVAASQEEFARCAGVIDGLDVRSQRGACMNDNCRYESRVTESCSMPLDPATDYPVVACGDYRASNATCRDQSTCYYRPAVYGGEPDLTDDEVKAKDSCAANADYQNNLGHGISGSSKYGEATCFQKTKDTDAKGSLAQCVALFQDTAQSGYIIFILVFSPVQLLAAYIGWVLPEIYIKNKESEKEVGFDMDEDNVVFVNPLESDEEKTEKMKKVYEAKAKSRAAAMVKQEGKPLDDDFDLVALKEKPLITRAESDRLFIKRGKTLTIFLKAEGPDDKLGLVLDKQSRSPPRISKVTSNGLAHAAKLQAGWAIIGVQGQNVEVSSYATCVAAIKKVDYNLGDGLELTVMLPPGEDLEGEGDDVSDSDDEDAAKEAEAIAAQRRKEQEETEAAQKKQEQEKKPSKKGKKKTKKKKKSKKDDAAAAEEGLMEGVRFVNPMDEDAEDDTPSPKAAAAAAAAGDDLTIDVAHGGGKRYRATLPSVIRAAKDLRSEKLGNLHPPEEIVRCLALPCAARILKLPLCFCLCGGLYLHYAHAHDDYARRTYRCLWRRTAIASDLTRHMIATTPRDG